MSKILKGIFGTRNSRELKRMGKVVKKINALADDTKALSDEQLAAKTDEFRQRLEAGETLFVAVHMEAAANDARTCVNVCTDPVSSVSDAWSYAPEPPYDWVLLSDLGLSLDSDVDLIGKPVE